MYTPPLPGAAIIELLVEGVIGAVVAVIVPAFLLSRFTRDIIGRSLLVIFLFIAAGAYVGFVFRAGVQDVGPIWLLAELGHAIVFSAMGLLGLLRGSPYWIAAGWALHPLWDVVLHYIGSGYAFAPITYAIACVGFDLVIAVYIVIAYGLVGTRRLRFQDAAT